MNMTLKSFTGLALSLALLAPTSFAQDRPDHRDQDHHDDRGPQGRGDEGNNHYVRHNEWKRGRRMNNNDWSRGERIDYRQHHLSAPRRGYEWRQVDGNYVMAAVATGLIASIVIAANGR